MIEITLEEAVRVGDATAHHYPHTALRALVSRVLTASAAGDQHTPLTVSTYSWRGPLVEWHRALAVRTHEHDRLPLVPQN